MKIILFGTLLLICSCHPSETPSAPPAEAAKPEISEIRAEQIATDGSWGNTEGPAVDSNNNLYFTSRGTYTGIIQWNAKDGAQRYAAVATKEGPGGLWVDDADSIFFTATGERQIGKLSPKKKVTVVAKAFEADPKVATGPNDLVVARSGVVYFTDPNGYDGTAPNGTVYMVGRDGKTRVFSNEITGPNGIVLSADEKTLYVSHNTAKTTSRIESWPLLEDGSGGPRKELAKIDGCVADGMALDIAGALWLTCYSFGTAYRVMPDGKITDKITTEQKALTNVRFGRGTDNHTLYFTSSDMERKTGYIYRATVRSPGVR